MSWQLTSTALVVLALAGGLAWYERRRPSSKLVAVVAVMAAAAVAGRLVLNPIPNVQPTTDIALVCGFTLGAGPGFAVGAIAALASNFFLGQGPWTPWEMLGWGAAGLAGAALAALRVRPRRLTLALVCALAGFAFGAWMDLFTLLNFTAESTGDTYLAIAATSLPFNVAHASGNALLALALGPALVRLLVRFRRRFEVDWRPVPGDAPPGAPAGDASRGGRPIVGAGTAAMLLALAVLGPAVYAQPADAAGEKAAVRYLKRAQNVDGGFGNAPGQPSNQLITGWAAIGLEAGGRNPLDVRRGGRSAIDFMRSQASALRDTGEIERTMIALRGAGLDPRRFAGRNLAASLVSRQRENGSFDGLVNWTAYGILAMRAAGPSSSERRVERAARFVVSEQGADGGFSFSGRRGASDVDDTGSALQALAVASRKRSAAVKRAVTYLRRQQNPDGGFGQLAGGRSNAQSTAWAVQGLSAVGVNPSAFRSRGARSPLSYLLSLQRADGSFHYSRTSAQTPVWVTAQALVAIRRRSLPLRPVRRAKRSMAKQQVEDQVNRQVNRRVNQQVNQAVKRAQHRREPAMAPPRRTERRQAPIRSRSRQASIPAVAPEPASDVVRAPEQDGGLAAGLIAAVAGGSLALLGAALLVRRRRRHD